MRNIFKLMVTNIKNCTNYHFHIKCTRNEHYPSQNKCWPGSVIVFGVPVAIKDNKANDKATLERLKSKYVCFSMYEWDYCDLTVPPIKKKTTKQMVAHGML